MVSVIIPNYNHAPYLNQRICSILSQTYLNFEVIILDDCSTDNSLEIIDHYSNDKRIAAVVQNESNSGSPFAQWKKGVYIAKGDIVWIAESDDACDTTFLERLVDLYIQSGVVMAFSLSRRMNHDGSLGEVIQKGVSQNLIIKGTDYISSNISLITNASSAVFSRSCALSIDNNYYDYKGAGDWLFWTGIASQGNVGILAEPLNYYRIYENNTTSKLFSNGRDFYELNKIYSYLLNNGYWSKFLYYRNTLKMVYAIRFQYEFDSDDIKSSLLKKWTIIPYLDSFLCHIMRLLWHIKKLIDKNK